MNPLNPILWQEFIESRTWMLWLVFALSQVFVRILNPQEGSKTHTKTNLLLLLHAFLIPIAAGLRQIDSTNYDDIRFVYIFLASFLVVTSVTRLFFHGLLPRLNVQNPRILEDLANALITLIVFYLVASRVGYQISGVLTTSAVLTMVLGFAFQDTLGNVIGGTILQIDHSIKVGDWIKMDDKSGRVTEVRWRYTSVETRNWETLIIPNSILMKSQVMVLGRRQGEPVQWRRWVYFNVDFRTAPGEVIRIVNEMLKTLPQEVSYIATAPEPNCLAMDLGDSTIRYAARYWLTDLALDDPTDSLLRLRIQAALKRENIGLSLPAQTVFVTENNPLNQQAKQAQELQKRLQAVSHIQFFDALSPTEKEYVANHLREAPFVKGEVMTRQGAEGHWLYMILSGTAGVSVTNESGFISQVGHLQAGQFFGEMSLMTGEPRSSTVIAETDVSCYRFDKSAFQDIIKARPDMAEAIAHVLAQRKAELEAVKQQLQRYPEEQIVLGHKHDILNKIRVFFGINDVA